MIPKNTELLSSGGFYHRESNLILTYRQPTDYYSRHVVLHETAHWYCAQLLGARYEKLPHWLCEGLADFCAFHVWNGKTLHASQMPRVSLENYPSRLAKIFHERQNQFSNHDQNLSHFNFSPETIEKLFEELQSQNDPNAAAIPHDIYALAWGLTAFFIECFPEETRQFFYQFEQHDFAESWRLAFDSAEQQMQSQFPDWLNERQLKWEWIWNFWEDDGELLTAVSGTTALLVQNAAALKKNSPLRFETSPLLDGTMIGVVIRYENSETFEMLQFRGVGTPKMTRRRIRFTDKKWETLTDWETFSPKKNGNNSQNDFLEIEILPRPTAEGNTHIQIFADKILIFEFDNEINTNHQPQRFGIAVQTGAASFRF